MKLMLGILISIIVHCMQFLFFVCRRMSNVNPCQFTRFYYLQQESYEAQERRYFLNEKKKKLVFIPNEQAVGISNPQSQCWFQIISPKGACISLTIAVCDSCYSSYNKLCQVVDLYVMYRHCKCCSTWISIGIIGVIVQMFRWRNGIKVILFILLG